MSDRKWWNAITLSQFIWFILAVYVSHQCRSNRFLYMVKFSSSHTQYTITDTSLIHFTSNVSIPKWALSCTHNCVGGCGSLQISFCAHLILFKVRRFQFNTFSLACFISKKLFFFTFGLFLNRFERILNVIRIRIITYVGIPPFYISYRIKIFEQWQLHIILFCIW